ncbi:GGDEF domain-containing protein [uncultured Deinococcus sp.]|uniref:GGDEF domain-containing protein n=1 Tax=uncultured Deinococcus sp. TaxID=158789 RepID=UPI0025846AE3|nr:GGDEF domain-containing protein [uncultured Deinococcus sp.]
MDPSSLFFSPEALLGGVLWLTVTFVCLLMLGLTWWRPSYAGWRGWACGNAGVVLGMLIGALRTPDTRLTSVLLGNGLVLLGSALLLLAFTRFAGGRPTRRALWGHGLGLFGTLLALGALTVLSDQPTARFALVSVFLLVNKGALLHLVLREIRRTPALAGAYRLNLGLLLLTALLTLPRTWALLSGQAPADSFMPTLPNLLTALAFLTMAVGGAFAFWALHEDRRREEVRALHGELERLAHRDPLTGLLNRRGFRQAQEQWEARGGPEAAILLVFDIDGFKTMNDRLGHALGDDCLRALAACLDDVAREGDVAGRMGGDEFLLLLTGPAAQIEAQVSGLTSRLYPGWGTPLGFSASFGAARFRRGDSLDGAVRQADEAMYARKAAGLPRRSPQHSPAAPVAPALIRSAAS